MYGCPMWGRTKSCNSLRIFVLSSCGKLSGHDVVAINLANSFLNWAFVYDVFPLLILRIFCVFVLIIQE